MIDIRKLKELVRLMVSADLTELDLRDAEEQVTLRRGGSAHDARGWGGPSVPPPPAAGLAAPPAASAPAVPPVDDEDEDLTPIQSPMVGTYYAKPGPDAQPFVSAGTRVNPDTVVCLVEAMKIFNEIKAETSGVIERVLVNSGEPVEFGQTLFLVRQD
jgi:acetyl-CoA carboxylase biotin carboxyl carrier protein